ncbi:uncharacterized protein MELLADRAFT_76425 [Melampsora larici-populina 98AG31]|uniref:Uncharacterized protein n=1 Tax=Melampsora larici-populina (strain 98AG31 / pathotype 3-4-7) TaxID=747676 RepID=F4R659_MELLP|nr:uncharacterized protein MELLADRAFT_76425 [Melampsora larici-populina 98AG31]EGG11828.1 hypothetical protein MELLADRAFT_76425 [Melampsora larici-populina 98AG31]
MAQFQPLTDTSMPYFLNNRTTSSSSLKTRQRETYEASHDVVSRPLAPQLQITLADGDSDDEDHLRGRRPSLTPDNSYPACELPFSSEPALESELETELPPLKKLRSSRNGGVSEDGVDSGFCPETVRGILTKKDHSSQSSPEGSGHSSPVQMSPISQELSSLPLSRAHTVNSRPDPRPTSRRNSSCQSAVSSLNSNKTVRFATEKSPPTCNPLCQRHQPSDHPASRCSCHLENPVATVMYLTHSAKVYDRTSIVVEKSLRLPPRQDASECGRWVQRCESSTAVEGRERSRLGSCSPTPNFNSDDTASRNKDCEAWRDKNHAIASNVPEGVNKDTFPRSPPSTSFPSMATHTSGLNLQQFRKQEQFEEDLDDEDEEARSETEVDDDDEVDCSVGTWSQGQVFKDDDILGGF